jgi:hypothetical protein
MRPRVLPLVFFSGALLIGIGVAQQHRIPSQNITLVTYLTSPNFCTSKYGYTVPAFCAAPGEIPLGKFAIPDVGSSYADPNFGAKVRILTDNSVDSLHQYSAPTAFSANAKYAFLGAMDGHVRIVDVATAKVLINLPADWDFSSPRWSPVDDDVLYIVGGLSQPNRILKYQVSTRTKTTLIDYSRDSHHFSRIDTGGTGDISPDNWLAFWAQEEHQVCAVDMGQLRTYCTDYTAPQPASHVPWGSIDYILITKGKDSDTGKRYVVLMMEPALGVFSVNEEKGTLEFENRSPEIPAGMMGGDSGKGNKDGICDPGEGCITTPHADVFEDRGKQYLLLSMGFDQPACEADLISLDLSKGTNMLTAVEQGGGRRTIMKQFGCGLTWSSLHFGCARSHSAYCVISIDTPSPDLPTAVRNGNEPFHSEVMVMRGNGAEIRRLAMHRSVLFQYWDQPRACISSDGRLVLWDTNFGIKENHRVVIAETGFGGPVTKF